MRLRVAAAMSVASLSFLVWACADDTGTEPQITVAAVTVTPATISLVAGDTAQLTATVKGSDGSTLTNRSVTFASSDTAVATVDTAGLVRAVRHGAITVTATCEGRSDTASVTVALRSVAAVEVAPDSLSLLVGDTARLSVTLTDDQGHTLSGRVVTLASSDTAVATVDTAGLVRAVGPGTAALTASSEGRSDTAVVVAVPAVPPLTVGAWTTIGPTHINGANGREDSGRLSALAVYAPDPDIMYGGGGRGGPLTQAGVFRTTDGGQTWTLVVNGLTDGVVNALWVDQTDADLVLAATEFDGIFRSTNGGALWSPVGSFAADRGAASDLVSVGSTVYAATGRGIAQSTDKGATWTVVATTTSPARVLAAGGGQVMATTDDNSILWRMADGSWKASPTEGSFPAWAAIDPAAPDTAYAVFGPYADALMVRTTDGGATWDPIDPPSCYGPQTVLFTETSHALYAGCNGTLFKSSDGAASWTGIPDAGFDIRGLFWAPDSRLMVGTDQGLHATDDDGATWTSLSGGASMSLLSGVSAHDNTVFTAVQDFSPIVSYDGGTSWYQPAAGAASPPVGPVGEDGQVFINPGNPSYCYAYTTAGYQYSTDGCHAFARPTESGVSGIYVQPGGTDMIAVDPGTPSTLYLATPGGVYTSTDWGVTMTATGWPMTEARAVAVDPVDARIVYVGTTSGFWRTDDGGVTWSQVSLAGAAGSPTTIAVDPSWPALVLVGLSSGPGRGGGVVKSVDHGKTFRLANIGLSTVSRSFVCCGVDTYALRFDGVGHVALATTTGRYVSVDHGDHWLDITGDVITSYTTDIQWSDGYLYAATFGAGVLRAPVTTGAPPIQRPGVRRR